MRKQKYYFSLTFAISILFGIILPTALGVKAPMLIATTFSMVWVAYAIMLLVTVFLIKPGARHRKRLIHGILFHC